MLTEQDLPIVKSSSARERLDGVFQSLQELDISADITDREDTPFAFGGFADVYRARSLRHKKRVAVKRIRMHLVEEDEKLLKVLFSKNGAFDWSMAAVSAVNFTECKRR